MPVLNCGGDGFECMYVLYNNNIVKQSDLHIYIYIYICIYQMCVHLIFCSSLSISIYISVGMIVLELVNNSR